MDAFKDDSKLISINKSIAANGNVIPSLVALHVLSGCNFMPMMFGLVKLKALKAVSKLPLREIGNADANLEDEIRERKQFVAKCHGRNQLS